MKVLKMGLVLALSVLALVGCKDGRVKMASFNLSFDRSTFEQLADEMQTPPGKQKKLVRAYMDDKDAMAPEDRTKAEKIIQIRNMAAIIQANRPDVIMMGEFNNDGTGSNLSALKGFKKHYLAHGQSLNSIDGGDKLKPIHFPYIESFPTNTGLNSGLDLDNDGLTGQLPGDAWGFGFYHGQYAFAVMSKHKILKRRCEPFSILSGKTCPRQISRLSQTAMTRTIRSRMA